MRTASAHSEHISFGPQYPAHSRRYRRFTDTLTGTAARLAVNRGSAHPSFQGLSPLPLRQLAWRTLILIVAPHAGDGWRRSGRRSGWSTERETGRHRRWAGSPRSDRPPVEPLAGHQDQEHGSQLRRCSVVALQRDQGSEARVSPHGHRADQAEQQHGREPEQAPCRAEQQAGQTARFRV